MSATKKTGSGLLRVLLAALASFVLSAAGCAADEEARNAASEKDKKVVAEAASSEEVVWPVARIASRVEPSVVQVNVAAIQTTPFGPRETEGIGSGVIFREDGYVLTNNHVVEGADTVNVAFADGSVQTGRVVGTDPFTDIAVVKVSRGNLPAADFADGGELVVGQLAVAIGNPSGFQSTVTSGIISGLHREIPPEITGGSQQSALVDLIQTDAAISPGSSGGALVGGDAKVIGINVAYLPPTQTGAVNIGFAIPADTASDVARQIIEEGKVEHPYLGVGLTDLSSEVARRFDISVESGALVTRVDPQGPAAEAGIEPGGVITAVGSERVRGTGDLLSALRRYDPGEPVEISVAKGGEASMFTVELEERG